MHYVVPPSQQPRTYVLLFSLELRKTKKQSRVRSLSLRFHDGPRKLAKIHYWSCLAHGFAILLRQLRTIPGRVGEIFSDSPRQAGRLRTPETRTILASACSDGSGVIFSFFINFLLEHPRVYLTSRAGGFLSHVPGVATNYLETSCLARTSRA